MRAALLPRRAWWLAGLAATALALAVALVWRLPADREDGPPAFYEYDLSEFPPAAGSIQPGDIVRLRLRIRQVMPFMPGGGTYKYVALGGYPVRPDGREDVRYPVMVVLPYAPYGPRASPGATWQVRGRAMLLRGTAVKASQFLTAELERDLTYIASRVNYWPRATLWGLEVVP